MLSHTVLKIHSDPDRMQLPESSCDSNFECQSEPEEVNDFFPSISSTLSKCSNVEASVISGQP